uniref:meiotic recombination protein REC114 n=1 Tax=Jaculus jaculus TaxID=51337 RepID=UPI001E1B1133|nr:meiotic recombination protein REC114 [Jaculus jaculus]
MAEAGNMAASLGLLGQVSQWPLKRYGRYGHYTHSETNELSELCPKAATEESLKWKVFESNEESGHLFLSIVISGHFFISQGQTLLEGFSLIGSKNWLKIVRRKDCLLFGIIKNKSHMFRVQFGGESQEAALEHCCCCVQSLAQYVTILKSDGVVQESEPNPGLQRAGEDQGQDCAERAEPHLNLEQQRCVAAGTGALERRTSVVQLAQTVLVAEQLPLVYEQSSWSTEELGPFLRLCLMDQNFPAFVEEVEKELKKLTVLGN